MKRQRWIGIVLLLAVVALWFPGSLPFASAASAPTRVIHVVYDDSGSMYIDTTLWSQAKYAAETFAAMLSDTDSLRVYLMSDFVASPSIKTPRLSLSGKNSAAANVREVHDMITVSAQGTPFGSVRQAYEDLRKETADEKWLVVLTDGAFNDADGNAVNRYFQGKSPDVRVFFLAIGEEAAVVHQDEQNHIYFDHAKTGAEVLSKITGMCTRIFNSNKLNVDTSALRISFDVPMQELIVFAQGQNVDISGIVDASGSLKRSGTPVHVQYSTQPAKNYPDAPYDPTLNGYVATFTGSFAAGNYTLSLTGADTVEVYYKPDVEIEVYLTDSMGREVSEDKMEAGDYTLNFCFVKRGTDTRLPKSSLLGDIDYSAQVISNGVAHGRTYTQGDTITLDEGAHRIDASALYLDYNTVTTSLVKNIYRNKAVSAAVGDPDAAIYRLTEYGLDRETPVSVHIQLDGRDFTADEWRQLSAPEVTAEDSLVTFRSEKGAVGELLVYPSFTGSTRADAESAIGTHSVRIQTGMTQEVDESWYGYVTVPVQIDSGYREILYTPVSVPTYELSKDGFVNGDEPILVDARFADRSFTAAEWAAMTTLPEATVEEGRLGAFRVEKTAQIGQYAFYPTLYKESVSKTDAVDTVMQIQYTERMGNEVWGGDGGNSGLQLGMTDSRSWFVRNRDRIILWSVIGAALLLFLGYVPPFKKRLPRSLKARPTISCSPRRPGPRPAPTKGQFTKKRMSSLLPYVAETGTIRFMPKGVGGAPAMAVKAMGGSAMSLTNVRQYAGKSHIIFNGDSIPKEATKKVISAGVLIEVRTDTMTYTCQPNT